MAIHRVLTAPHPILSRVAEPVQEITPEILRLLDDMVETMIAEDGAGLAAPQIGVSLRMITFDIPDDHPRQTKPHGFKMPMKVINPVIVWQSKETICLREGCLSLPDIYEPITRAEAVRVQYMDETGQYHEIEATHCLARGFLHEVDHLNGILSIDYISRLKRQLALKKMRKFQMA